MTDAGIAPPPQASQRGGIPRWLRALLVVAGALVVVLIAVGAVAARSYKTFYIPGIANEPALRPGDRIVVRKGHGVLHRGDVIIYKATAPCSQAPDQIKRIVAIAGDRVSSSSGKLLVNGQPPSEPYLALGTTTDNVTDLTVPADAVYILGDNRTNSKDSRYCGPIRRNHVVGRAVLRVWPLGRAGGL